MNENFLLGFLLAQNAAQSLKNKDIDIPSDFIIKNAMPFLLEDYLLPLLLLRKEVELLECCKGANGNISDEDCLKEIENLRKLCNKENEKKQQIINGLEKVIEEKDLKILEKKDQIKAIQNELKSSEQEIERLKKLLKRSENNEELKLFKDFFSKIKRLNSIRDIRPIIATFETQLKDFNMT